MKIGEPIADASFDLQSKYSAIWEAVSQTVEWVPVTFETHLDVKRFVNTARIHRKRLNVKQRGLTAYVRQAQETV